MAKIMIQGTSSSVGKSILVSALSRIYSNLGYDVAPFKSQNMSRIYTELEGGLKMSSAQVMQALAARKEPDIRMNPILLIPETDIGSDVIVNGKSVGKMKAKEYFEYKTQLKNIIIENFNQLEEENDLVIIEGAGSPAEINLWDEDIVNMGLANMVDSDVLLVGDIDRGGVFAHLYGTVMILPENERNRIKGLIINKFRGDPSLIRTGFKQIEGLTRKPVLGLIPYIKLELQDEDSLIDYEKDCNKVKQSVQEIDEELDKLAKMVEKSLDIEKISKIIGL